MSSKNTLRTLKDIKDIKVNRLLLKYESLKWVIMDMPTFITEEDLKDKEDD